jgi:hypothetical protein
VGRSPVNPLEACKPVPAESVKVEIQVSGHQLKLSWPATAEGYQLQSTTNLLNAQWNVPNVQVETNNAQKVATVPIAGVSEFFRLAK